MDALAAVREAVGAAGARDHAAARRHPLPDPQHARPAIACALTVDAVGADDRFLVGLDGSVRRHRGQRPAAGGAAARAAAGRDRARPLRGELPPGDRDGRAAVRRPRCAAGKRPGGRGDGRMTLPFAPELRPHPPGRRDGAAADEGPALLAATAARTGGRLVSDPRELLRRRPRPPRDPPAAANARFCWRPPCCSWPTSSCGASGCRDAASATAPLTRRRQVWQITVPASSASHFSTGRGAAW